MLLYHSRPVLCCFGVVWFYRFTVLVQLGWRNRSIIKTGFSPQNIAMIRCCLFRTCTWSPGLHFKLLGYFILTFTPSAMICCCLFRLQLFHWTIWLYVNFGTASVVSIVSSDAVRGNLYFASSGNSNISYMNAELMTKMMNALWNAKWWLDFEFRNDDWIWQMMNVLMNSEIMNMTNDECNDEFRNNEYDKWWIQK